MGESVSERESESESERERERERGVSGKLVVRIKPALSST